jgi:nitrogen fixation protein NifB
MTEKRHPCFDAEAKSKYARVHLPVAPLCNVQCSYCNRRFDCANESRPGVSSAVLLPEQALLYLRAVVEKIPETSAVGIAGPGDPFANVEQPLRTLKLVEKEFPDMMLCLASNGLGLAPYIGEVADLGVSHVTLTVNSINPDTLAKMYRWVRFNRRVYRGADGGKVLLEQQLSCIPKLKDSGMTVKVNTVVCCGVNDAETEELDQALASLGADTMSCIPMYPVANTEFELLPEISGERMKIIQAGVARFIRPMLHCARCRADAAGLLGDDNVAVMSMVGQFSTPVASRSEGRELPLQATRAYSSIFTSAKRVRCTSTSSPATGTILWKSAALLPKAAAWSAGRSWQQKRWQTAGLFLSPELGKTR